MKHPPYLAAIDWKRNRVFVLATPSLCALKIEGVWQRCSPLSDSEIAEFDLVSDLKEAEELVIEAHKALSQPSETS